MSVTPLELDVESFELDGRDVAEALVQAIMVEPANPTRSLEFQLRARAPHAISDQLGKRVRTNAE